MSKTTNPPYPTTHAIEDMFNNKPSRRDAFSAILNDNCDMKIMGYDHHFAGEEKGKDRIAKIMGVYYSGILKEDTINFEVVHVIGGSDTPWASVEGKLTAKTKSGKKFVHEYVNIMRFNAQGKCVKLRSYFDSHHVHSQVVEQGMLHLE